MTNKNTQYTDILSMVTHDLKSPMTAIMGELDMLSLDNLSKEEFQYSIKSARKASKSMIKLIENILVMAKIEAGKENIQFENIKNLKEHFKDMIATFKFEIKQKNINFVADIQKELPEVYWDIDKLHYHAFNNILSNALKFTNQNGNIHFKVIYKKSDIVISIKDDGIGIKEDKLKTIFDKFDTHKNQKIYKGNGLGLYNAYNFITKHNGNITTTEGLNNKGIGFLIQLPIKGN